MQSETAKHLNHIVGRSADNLLKKRDKTCEVEKKGNILKIRLMYQRDYGQV